MTWEGLACFVKIPASKDRAKAKEGAPRDN